MPTIDILVRRFSVVSQRPFEEIIRGLTATIGGPDIKTFTMGCRGLDRWSSSKPWCDGLSDPRT